MNEVMSLMVHEQWIVWCLTVIFIMIWWSWPVVRAIWRLRKIDIVRNLHEIKDVLDDRGD